MNIYSQNIRQYEVIILKLSNLLKRLSILRLVIFVISLSLILIFANGRLIQPLFIAVPICVLVFGLIIKRYYKVAFEKQQAEFLKEINEDEILRLANKLAKFPSGQAFVKKDHPYVADFDIFGSHSLFRLIDRTTTESGSAMLAEWLSEPATKDVILKRQEAVKELTPKLDWRQEFQSSGMHFSNKKSDYNKLLSWVGKPVQLLPNQYKYLTVSILLSIVSTSTAVYFLYNLFYIADFSGYYIIPLLISLLINRLVLKRVRPIAEEIIDNTHVNTGTLGGYQTLITKIEGEKFDSEILNRLQSDFSKNSYSASKEINKLRKILEMFQGKGTRRSIGKNDIYTLFNSFWFFDVYLILLTEKWKNRNSPFLLFWASAVSEFEVLSSLAGFSYSNPTFTFPEIRENFYVIDFEELGHPLILSQNRVCNDFTLNGKGEIALITGSNMAGKSTFLRTVGVNLVLALMGAPCCAKSGRVSPMKIFTSMRTQDNLEEGISSFYAELKRIEQLLQLIESGEAIFFLLDEMFKGTNSQDRYKGGASLIKQLSELNAFGIISTHDLELAKLTVNQSTVANFSFNSEIQGGEIIFNYALTKGICTDFNASELMKKSGIKILADI